MTFRLKSQNLRLMLSQDLLSFASYLKSKTLEQNETWFLSSWSSEHSVGRQKDNLVIMKL